MGTATLKKAEIFSKHVNNVFHRDIIFLQYLDKPGVIDVVEAAQGCQISYQLNIWLIYQTAINVLARSQSRVAT